MYLVDTTVPGQNVVGQFGDKQLRLVLAGLIRITETMLDLAEKKEWDAVELLERGRRKDLASLGEMDMSQAQSPDIGEAYATLLSINDRISQLIDQERSQLMAGFGTAREKSRVAMLYQSS